MKRISQLARELNVSPSEIMKYLRETGIEADRGVSTRLLEPGVESVVRHFSKETVILSSEEDQTVDNDPGGSDNLVEDRLTEEPETGPAVVNETDEPIEVIRPQLIKLEGLKVVGKIELPEEKPREKKVIADSKDKVRDRNLRARGNERGADGKNAHIPYREKRKAEERAIKEQRELQQRLRKERKRKAYEERLRSVQARSAKSRVNPGMAEENEQEIAVPRPKTAWGRFLRWLNT